MDDAPLFLTTRTGFRFQVRPACPGDAVTVAEFFEHVTPEDMRFRFLSAMRTPGASQIDALTQVDHQRTEDFLAFSEDGRTMLATAMLACDADMQRGEVAIVLRGDHKGRGIGWELLSHVARWAETRGVTTLESIESRDNHAAIELERDMGFTARGCPDDPTLMVLSRTLATADA